MNHRDAFADRPRFRRGRALALATVLALGLTATPTRAETAAPDTTPAPTPTAVPTHLNAVASTDRSTCAKGGTIVYHLELSWEVEPGRMVHVEDLELPLAQGLDQLSDTQSAKSTMEDGRRVAQRVHDVTYRCAEPGTFELGPLPIKYYDGVNAQPNTAYAAAVSVTVSPGLIGRMQSPAGKAVLFVLGLAFFWGLVMLVRRARRSKAEQPAKAIPVPDRQDWDALAARARETPDGKFYADLEAAVWDEMFQLTHPQEGTSSTRLAALQNDGVPESAIAKLRQVVGQCEKNRHVDGPQSQGDAIEAVNQARAAVSEARDALLPAPEAAGRSDAPNAHND